MKRLLLALVRLSRWLLGLRLRTLLAAGLVAAAGLTLLASPVVPLARDFTIAVVAGIMDGDPIPVDEIDYAGGDAISLSASWGVLTNSQWLVERALEIIPYYSYDQLISRTLLPDIIAFVPNADARSFHVLGTSSGGAVRINSRFLTTDRADARDIYATLVHELLHEQGAPFTFVARSKPTEADRIRVESMTTAGTIEILAAICNARENEIACPTFWQEVGDLARVSMQVQLRELNADWLYQIIANALWRTQDVESRAARSMRFWARNMDELIYIQAAYGAVPWNEYVLPGFGGQGLPTLTPVPLDRPGMTLLVNAPFDDSRVITGPLGTWASVVTRLHEWAKDLMPWS